MIMGNMANDVSNERHLFPTNDGPTNEGCQFPTNEEILMARYSFDIMFSLSRVDIRDGFLSQSQLLQE